MKQANVILTHPGPDRERAGGALDALRPPALLYSDSSPAALRMFRALQRQIAATIRLAAKIYGVCRMRVAPVYMSSPIYHLQERKQARHTPVYRPQAAQMAHIIDVLSDFGARSSSQILFFPHRDTEPRADMFTLQARTEEPFPLCARLSRRSYRFLSLYPEPGLHTIPIPTRRCL